MKRLSRWLGLGFGVLALAGCGEASRATPSAAAAQAPAASVSPLDLSTILIEGVPHVAQKPDFCGEACVEMAERKLGRAVSQDDVFGLAGIDPSLGRGAYTKELVRAATSLGFEVGAVWYTTPASEPARGMDEQFKAVHADLARGVPSILCMHYGDGAGSPEHFRLVVGYDQATDEIVYHEPAEENGAYRRMSRAHLYALWPLKYEDAKWTLIRIPLAPGSLTDPPKRGAGPTAADYTQHLRALKERLPEGFAIRFEDPFVVVGNESDAGLERHAKSTVRWAVDHLRADFFDESPKEILDVWLFRDASSYEDGVLELTGESPSTPYGFYSPSKKGLFMNISTGGGTLVHEIVHPFVQADLAAHGWADPPAWINEGMGSLFEQSAERDGHIIGLTNWRLAGLQKAIKKGQTLPTFQELAAMSDHAFYDEDRGTNYAEARYLMYWLQENDLLRPFYKLVRGRHEDDPTGYESLVSVLGDRDMPTFEAEWKQYVLGLRFDPN
ncbi:MAG: C39 family peptidase [Polyangiaceae bacterium]